jgi:hypothetical protein
VGWEVMRQTSQRNSVSCSTDQQLTLAVEGVTLCFDESPQNEIDND